MSDKDRIEPSSKTEIRNGEFGHVTKTATTSHLGDKIAAVAQNTKPSTSGNTSNKKDA